MYNANSETTLFRRTGAATLVTGNGKKEESYRVHARDTGTAMHLDEVKAKATIKKPGQRRRRKPKTEVVPKVKVRVEKVIKRAVNHSWAPFSRMGPASLSCRMIQGYP